MSLRKCIFKSHYERELFKHLNSIWKNEFNIYPELPFAKVFEIDTLDIKKVERDYLLKTNIDYTICSKENEPLMCIEFDGMSYGYNKGGEYVQIKKNLVRKRKLDLKLRIAMEHFYPFYIISYNEQDCVFKEINLAVIDGIIGQTIAKLNFQEKINEFITDSRNEMETMSKNEYHEYIQDVVLMAEVELEMTWDPIAKKAAQIQTMLSNKNITSGWSCKHMTKPELPDINGINDIEGIKKRAKAWDEIEWHGFEISCETPKGRVTEQAWVRNFEGMLASPLIIAQNIAELITFYKVAILNGIQI